MTVGTIGCQKCGKECFFVPEKWKHSSSHLCSKCFLEKVTRKEMNESPQEIRWLTGEGNEK